MRRKQRLVKDGGVGVGVDEVRLRSSALYGSRGPRASDRARDSACLVAQQQVQGRGGACLRRNPWSRKGKYGNKAGQVQ